MDGSIDLEVTRVPGATVLSVAGELDVATAPALLEEALRLLGRGDDRIVLDLAAVPFLDSSGINAIVGILRSTRHRGHVAIAGPCRAVQRVFDLTSLDRLLPIAPSVPVAVDLLDRPSSVEAAFSRSDRSEATTA